MQVRHKNIFSCSNVELYTFILKLVRSFNILKLDVIGSLLDFTRLSRFHNTSKVLNCYFEFSDPIVPVAGSGFCRSSCPIRLWTPKAVLQGYKHISLCWGLRPTIYRQGHSNPPRSQGCRPWPILLWICPHRLWGNQHNQHTHTLYLKLRVCEGWS